MRWLVLVLLCGCSAPPTVVLEGPQPPVEAKSTLSVDRTGGVVANGHDGVFATVKLLAADGGAAISSEVVFLLDGADGGVRFSDQGGQATQPLVSLVAGPHTVSAQVSFDGGGFTLQTATPVLFVPGPVSGVVWVQQPSTVQAGAVMAPPVRLQLRDANGNVVTGEPKTMRLRLVNSTSGATLTGADYRTSVDGGLTFDMLVIDRAQSGYNLRAEEQGSGLADESAPFNVTP